MPRQFFFRLVILTTKRTKFQHFIHFFPILLWWVANSHHNKTFQPEIIARKKTYFIFQFESIIERDRAIFLGLFKWYTHCVMDNF